MTARRWTDLAPQERRRQTAKTGLAILLGWTVILGIYYLVPFTNRVGSTAILRLGSGIALFGAVLAWEIRRVALHDLPELRAVRALGITIPVFLIAFAGVYLSLSHASASHFSEPLNHTGALYLTVTVFSTVGFGDITPQGDLARILVAIQMLLDLVIIATIVRLLFSVARAGLAAAQPSGNREASAESTATPTTAQGRIS
jgi:hypothetical protein